MGKIIKDVVHKETVRHSYSGIIVESGCGYPEFLGVCTTFPGSEKEWNGIVLVRVAEAYTSSEGDEHTHGVTEDGWTIAVDKEGLLEMAKLLIRTARELEDKE